MGRDSTKHKESYRSKHYLLLQFSNGVRKSMFFKKTVIGQFLVQPQSPGWHLDPRREGVEGYFPPDVLLLLLLLLSCVHFANSGRCRRPSFPFPWRYIYGRSPSPLGLTPPRWTCKIPPSSSFLLLLHLASHISIRPLYTENKSQSSPSCTSGVVVFVFPVPWYEMTANPGMQQPREIQRLSPPAEGDLISRFACTQNNKGGELLSRSSREISRAPPVVKVRYRNPLDSFTSQILLWAFL